MTNTERQHLFIATPCFGGVVTQLYMQSVIALMVGAAGTGLGLTLGMLGQDALITRSRNTLVARFMASRATHLLFIDADIGFDPASALRLLAAGEEVVGGMYPLRAHHWNAATSGLTRGGEPAETASLRYVGDPSGPADARGLLPARHAGTGFLLIARTAITRLQEQYPETRCRHTHVTDGDANAEIHALFDCVIDPETREYLSEDFAFCARWRAIGGTVWLDPELQLTHAGMSEFAGRPDVRYEKQAVPQRSLIQAIDPAGRASSTALSISASVPTACSDARFP